MDLENEQIFTSKNLKDKKSKTKLESTNELENLIKDNLQIENELEDNKSDNEVEISKLVIKTKTVKSKTDYILNNEYSKLKEYLNTILPLFDNYEIISLTIKEFLNVLENGKTNVDLFKKIGQLAENRKTAQQSLFFTTTETNSKRSAHYDADRKSLLSLQNSFLYLNKEIYDKNNYNQKNELKKVDEFIYKFELLDGLYVVKPEFLHQDDSEYMELKNNISSEVIKKINCYLYAASLLLTFQLILLEDYNITDLTNPGLKLIKDKIVTMFGDEGTVKRKAKTSEKVKEKVVKKDINTDNLNFETYDMSDTTY